MSDTPKTDDQFYKIARNEWVVDADFARDLERETAHLRCALKQARSWGVASEGYSSEQSRKLADWIDAGMVGAPPPIPDYYAASQSSANTKFRDPGDKRPELRTDDQPHSL